MRFAVHRMETEDVGKVFCLEKACFGRPWSEEDLLGMTKSEQAVCVVAEADGVLLGYGIFSILYETADLCRIAVKEDCRGKGIGRELLRVGIMESHAAGAERIMLEVRISNSAACSLYEKIGFQKIGKRKNYYNQPVEDALLMELPCISYIQTNK